MAEEAVVEQTVTESVVEAPNPRKFSRTIPIKDKDGNSLNPQVFYGATEQELADRMADSIMHSTLKIRELTLKEKMAAAQKAPEGAELTSTIPEPKPRDLTADERSRIAEQMKDPATVVEGYRELHRATTGRTPEEEIAAKERMERESAITATQAAAKAFIDAHPEFYSTKENGRIMGEYLASHAMATTSVRNYEIAFKELSADGLLQTMPEEAPIPEVVVPEPPRIEAPKKEKTAFPSAITRDQASGTGAVKPKKPSAAEVSMMNAREYRAYLESTGQWGK